MIKQPILVELNYFVTAMSNIHRGLSKEVSSQLVSCSLHLLEELPSTRDAVLEYFSIVFDINIGIYISFLEKDPQGNPPEDESITEIQEVLENLITNGPAAWAPLISTWSLQLLGKLSEKHTRGRPLDIGNACKLWLGSSAMRCLLGLSALCFGKLNSAETEQCISALLAIFDQYSQYFDWVVARLGGCFPLKVISKILQCGLKGFSGNANSTLDSEVGILGYLSHSHEKDLKIALNEMLQPLFVKNQPSQPVKNTIPYLLHLSGMSEILLQPIVTVFLDLFDESVIPTLTYHCSFWAQKNDLYKVMANLALKIGTNGTKILLTLGRIAKSYIWVQNFLEFIIQELERLILDKCMCPLLLDVPKNESRKMLWEACRSDNFIEQQTAVRLILLVAHKYHLFYHQTIDELLTSSTNMNTLGISALIRILGGPNGIPENIEVKPGLELALERILLQSKGNKNTETHFILKNILNVIKHEKNEISPHLGMHPMTRSGRECLSKFLDIFKNFIEKVTKDLDQEKPFCDEKTNKKIKMEMEMSFGRPENIFSIMEQLHILIELLDALELDGKDSELGITDILKMIQLTVKYFFWILTEKNLTIRLIGSNRCYSLLSRQCTIRKAARTSALRDLLEGALYMYANLFGVEIENDAFSLEKKDDQLISLNQRLGVVSSTNRSILHAGIIGQGIRIPASEIKCPKREIQSMFIKAIAACCQSDEISNTIDGFSTVSLILVEMVSSDVMYNGLPWLDEEFTKITMERDLHIRRTFNNAPILWSIMGLIASNRPSLCYASVLLRGLCASVLHQWRAKSMEKQISKESELMDVTTKLLEIMGIGQFLPPPLSFLHLVLEFLESHEIALVLRECVWNYMREFVPAPVLFQTDRNGVHWRDPIASRVPPQFTDLLRHIMQKKLKKVGHLYHLMFVLPTITIDD